MSDAKPRNVESLCSSSRRRILGSAAVLVSILAGSLIAEAGLTLAGFSHPIFFRADRLTGTAHIPNVEGIYSAEGRAHVAINSDGWRDDEHSPAKPLLRGEVPGD